MNGSNTAGVAGGDCINAIAFVSAVIAAARMTLSTMMRQDSDLERALFSLSLLMVVPCASQMPSFSKGLLALIYRLWVRLGLATLGLDNLLLYIS